MKLQKSRRSSYTRVALKSEPDDTLQVHSSHLNPLNQQNWHTGMTFDNSYQTPSNKRAQSVYPEPDSPQKVPYQNDESLETGKQAGSGTPTLKGVIHEGMGMFDAATPEMKRVRNQRKHPSVIDKMMLVSESISMTEQVWNESMTKVEHERSVYDTPTDLSSPVGSTISLHDSIGLLKAKLTPLFWQDFKDDEDGEEPLPKKLRGPRAGRKASDTTSERLTRSATRAMKGASTRASRGGKRGGRKQGEAQRGRGKKASKAVEEELDSDEGFEPRHGKRRLSVFHDDPTGNESLGADVFGGRPQTAHGKSSFHPGTSLSLVMADIMIYSQASEELRSAVSRLDFPNEMPCRAFPQTSPYPRCSDAMKAIRSSRTTRRMTAVSFPCYKLPICLDTTSHVRTCQLVLSTLSMSSARTALQTSSTRVSTTSSHPALPSSL